MAVVTVSGVHTDPRRPAEPYAWTSRNAVTSHVHRHRHPEDAEKAREAYIKRVRERGHEVIER